MLTSTSTGFIWGPMRVSRVTPVKSSYTLQISTEAGKVYTIQCSPTGRSLRVFDNNGKEMLA